ncbi:hypothetical protein GCM10009527_095670 [Actinomadura nitritigenes]|uniref:Uncharacterized protein n=1 Tax=Actinomadura nitritigenes TaxID=134602 RepID=A0ABS3R371_9ACTN|nr:hypothetical protein [Actinomadura nitritigenes]MBO2440272.1 hypothetical protein [Actinomadura nitritigenes]
MTDHDFNATQLARATQIIRTYEQRAFPGGGSLLDRDPLYTRALLSALINDLEHYAANHDLDFSEVVTSGLATTARDTADQASYKVGDEVRMPRHGDRCGTIVGWTTSRSESETTYLIEIPGIPHVLAELAAHLAPAPPFPRTETVLGTVVRADQAERSYISLAARLTTAKASDRRALARDCDNLITALSSWTGVPADQLRDELGPKPPPNAPAGRPSDAAAAANDFPHDITQVMPGTSAAPANRPNKPARRHRGPAQAA